MAVPTNTSQGVPLAGLERKLVFNRFRATVGLRWELPRLLESITVAADSLCLEIGTGVGWGTLGLVQLLHPRKVIATDYDGTILPTTRAYLMQHQAASHVALCQADAKRFPFPDATFDLVLALYVLHHVAGYGEALTDIARVTKPGGLFLVIDVIRATGMPHLEQLVPPTGLPTRAELTRLLNDVGFEVQHWRGLPIWVDIVAHKVEPLSEMHP